MLPKMFQDVSDKDMNILSDDDELRDGGAALTAYARMHFEEMTDYEREEIRKALESEDIEVSKEQPKAGMIGVAGVGLSLAPTKGVPAIGVIAETVGTSLDILAAERMSRWIEQAFDVTLDLDLDTTKETAARLMERMGEGSFV